MGTKLLEIYDKCAKNGISINFQTSEDGRYLIIQVSCMTYRKGIHRNVPIMASRKIIIEEFEICGFNILEPIIDSLIRKLIRYKEEIE